MTLDPHVVRMQAAQDSMARLEVLDDETIALAETAAKAIRKLDRRLRKNRVPEAERLHMLVGLGISVGLEELGP